MTGWITRIGLCLAVLLGMPAVARGDSHKVIERTMKFAERGGKLIVTTDYPDIWTGSAISKLDKGVVSTLVIRAYVYRKDDQEIPVSFVLASIRIVYDLWDETYQVQITGPLGKKKLRFRRRSDALAAVSALEAFPIAPLSRLRIGPHFLMIMVVELNPVSEALRAEMRRWMSRSGETTLDSGSSFFGSVVSVFVNAKSPEADAVLRLRSQPFYRTRPTARKKSAAAGGTGQ